MTFRSKTDRFFLMVYGITLLVIAIAIFLPFFIEDNIPMMAAVILIGTFAVCTGFMLWTLFDIAYIFNADHLFIKGGPFRSRIPYQQITRVSPTSDIYTGYRILSSRNGVEIFYRSALMGSVKISPADQQQFLDELKKRVPENIFHPKPY